MAVQDPIIETISSRFKTALEGIDGTDPYHTTIAKVTRLYRVPKGGDSLPLIVINEPVELKDDGPSGLIDVRATFELLAFGSEGDREERPTEHARFVKDIQLALMANDQWDEPPNSGTDPLAFKTRVPRVEPIVVAENPALTASRLLVDVWFRHMWNDPTEGKLV